MPIQGIEAIEAFEFGAESAAGEINSARTSLLLRKQQEREEASRLADLYIKFAGEATSTTDKDARNKAIEAMTGIENEMSSNQFFATAIQGIASSQDTKNQLQQLDFAKRLSEAKDDAAVFQILTEYLGGLGADSNGDGTIQLTELIAFGATHQDLIQITNQNGQALNLQDIAQQLANGTLDAAGLNGVLQNATVNISGPGFKIAYLEDGDGEMSIANDKILSKEIDFNIQTSNDAAGNLVGEIANRPDLSALFSMMQLDVEGNDNTQNPQDPAKNFSKALVANLLEQEQQQQKKQPEKTAAA